MEYDGGMESSIVSRVTVEVETLEATSLCSTMTSAIPVQPAVVKEVEVDRVVTALLLVDFTL